jgi:uncharacterized protein YcbK (DUF882 family)
MDLLRPRIVLPATLALGVLLGLAAPEAAVSGPSSVRSLSGDAPVARVARMALGRSGALRVAVVDPGEWIDLPLVWAGGTPRSVSYRWTPVGGTRQGKLLGVPVLGSEPLEGGRVRAPSGPGTWRLALRGEGWSQELTDLTVVTRVPFQEKRRGFVNGYHMGSWATEGSGRSDRYAPPEGFIEVTPQNQEMHVSEHFRLRNFLTKNQFAVWPKYVALDLRLIDKLELVVQELNEMGVRAEHVTVMSGFRTPAYNGPGEGGRAKLSRHTYGDASDVWVDNDRDGYMDDLNQDGRRDTGDAQVMLRAVERVEAKYPELVGGAGTYPDNGVHGPFIHIDVRGNRARWAFH